MTEYSSNLQKGTEAERQTDEGTFARKETNKQKKTLCIYDHFICIPGMLGEAAKR